MNTLSVDDVKSIHAAQAARKDAPIGFDARQATRVLVKAKLQEMNPVPYGIQTLTPEMLAVHERHLRTPGALPPSRKEHASHVAYMRSLVSEDDHTAFAKAKGTPDAVGVQDAHHFAQKMHQKALWTEADRLVGEAVSQ